MARRTKRMMMSLKISERLAVNITEFNDGLWYHLKDSVKQKSLSLSHNDIKELFKAKDELAKASRKLVNKMKKNGPGKKSLKKNPVGSKCARPASEDTDNDDEDELDERMSDCSANSF